jgi:hypothetical protein
MLALGIFYWVVAGLAVYGRVGGDLINLLLCLAMGGIFWPARLLQKAVR